MKVLLLNGSPHGLYIPCSLGSGGSSYEKRGIETEVVHIGNRAFMDVSGYGLNAPRWALCVFKEEIRSKCIFLG